MNIVKELRLSKGIQQKELAIEIGVSNATVSDWEHQRKNPSGERLRRLAEFFGVDPDVILGVASNEKYLKKSETQRTDADHIVERILEGLGPKSPEIRIVSGAMEKMTQEQQDQVVAVLRAMFANNPELFN